MTRPVNPDLNVQTLDCLKAFIAEKGWAPTRVELRDCLGLRSAASAQRRIDRLVEAGLIEVSSGSRALRIVE